MTEMILVAIVGAIVTVVVGSGFRAWLYATSDRGQAELRLREITGGK